MVRERRAIRGRLNRLRSANTPGDPRRWRKFREWLRLAAMKRMLAIALVAAPPLLWAGVFAANTALDSKVGFDFDDTIAFSSPSFRAAEEKFGEEAMRPKHRDFFAFWSELNGKPERDLPKPLTLWLARGARLLGCDVVIITARMGVGREPFVAHWKDRFDEIYFVKDKTRILERDRYLAFFGDSDADIAKAKKAGVMGVRIQRHPKSSNTYGYEPGRYGEWVVPGSEGPAES